MPEPLRYTLMLTDDDDEAGDDNATGRGYGEGKFMRKRHSVLLAGNTSFYDAMTRRYKNITSKAWNIL